MDVVSMSNVTLESGFLHDKQELNENVTMDAVYNRFSETGRIDAFRFDWKEGMDKKPHIFWDSDVAKWMEAAAYILQKKENPQLRDRVEELISLIEKNQCEDGYFNIYFTVCEPEKRFTNRDCHELYCAGHLTEAAIAYYQATGEDRFLQCMKKYMACIRRAFMVEKTAHFTTPGHEEIELALMRLYHCTGEEQYLKMALFFLNERGRNDTPISEEFNHKNTQSHLPVRQQFSAEGHAVRACYLYTAMAEAAKETNDPELMNACRALFEDIVSRKMYITGGIGSTRYGEAFTIPYDLPNDKAYAETCASISLLFFAHSMQKLEFHSVYADVMERELYNGILSGLSMDGKAFFYENPLEINLNNYTRFCSTKNAEAYAITQRKVVFGCSCCPPNLNRVLASVGNYIYGYEGNHLYIHQFTGSSVEINGMKVRQITDYPNSGKITIETENIGNLFIRIPSWCRCFTISENYQMVNGYAKIENPPSVIQVDFAMEPTLYQSNRMVGPNCGKAALQCGPIVYCAESVDNIDNLYELFYRKNFSYEIKYDRDFRLNRIVVDGYRKCTDASLYAPYSEEFEAFRIHLIPYSCFANRGESNMLVWLNVR